MDLETEVREFLNSRNALAGVAPIDRFADAPQGHHPSDICRDARTVVVYAVPVPRGMLLSPDYDLYALHRTYHSVYPLLDEIGLGLSNLIEKTGDSLAVPVPSFAPLTYEGREPWGILSLKHAAVRAGLGAFGRNGLVHNPEFGTLLRFGAVVTSAKLVGDSMADQDPCPPDCMACFKVCPSKALQEPDGFTKMTCLGHTIKHAIYPLTLKDEAGLKHIERIINTAGYNYWLTCNSCLKVCPGNRNQKAKTGSSSKE